MLFISYAAFKFIQYFKVIKYCFKEIEKQKFGTQRVKLWTKGQENPNFSAFDQLGSLTNNPVFEPGAFGKCSDGTEIVCKASSLKS